jgi:hypothetical protein
MHTAIQEEKLTSAKKEDEERKKANQQDQSARLQAVSKVCSRVDAADKNTVKRVRGGNVRDKTLDKELAEAENELELVEEELRDPDQMNVDQHGEDLVQDVSDRATAARREVARLRAQIQHSVSSDDDSGDEEPHGRICSTLQTQEDGADTQLQQELREDAEINAKLAAVSCTHRIKGEGTCTVIRKRAIRSLNRRSGRVRTWGACGFLITCSKCR